MNIELASNLKTPEKKTIDLVLNTNKNSDEYKKYYNEIEKYLLNHCKAMKMNLSASNIENEKSVSNNQAALDLYSKGLKYFKTDDYKKALPYFENAVKADSVFAFAWDNIGICYRRMENYDAAIYAYNRSLAIDPNGITPLQNIAVAYEYKKEYDKAIKAYETLSELDSFNPEVFYGIGRVYAFYLNDYEKGLDNMCKAYNLYYKQKSPYRVDAEKLISSIYYDMKKLNNTDKFNEILKANNISADFK
jgi:tetratricopeptide (TPR) repeat protein